MLSLIILFPLFGFLINGLWYAFFQSNEKQRKISSVLSGTIASTMIFLSFLMSLKYFLIIKSLPVDARFIEQNLFQWISIGDFHLPFTLRLDSLSILFCLVISGVGSLIHIYSIGYMSHDKTPGKFFAYLNLFCFAMLVLVLGNSLPVLFLGWEGVGLCSYLLIGYWYADIDKAIAGKKAFIVNRIGDLGFILGMFFLYSLFGTLEFTAIGDAVAQGQILTPERLWMVSAACFLLFVGCTGKSAQIPLYIWLPDAMAGPTPVSALIHAATMVTSGIYLITRLNFLFDYAPDVLHLIAWVGGITAFFAATIAVVQTDIKKVLAYSTVSQLGYMFLACGVGAYGAGVFHVMTHAFFKALLFLGAGSVIHGMHEEQNILKMGGLKKSMPHTFFVFMMGWLAICGVPLFSGFFSKDEILWLTFSSTHGSKALWVIGVITAIMTAFYMSRLFILTFLGESRNHSVRAHESPKSMIIPLYVLAILSVVGGYIGIPHFSWLEHWFEPILGEHSLQPGLNHNLEWILMAVSTLGAAFGMFLAMKFYLKGNTAQKIKSKNEKMHSILTNKWFVDEGFEWAIIKPIKKFSYYLWEAVDVGVIDKIVLGFGRASSWTGNTLRILQSGSVQVYLLVGVIGMVIAMGYLLYGTI